MPLTLDVNGGYSLWAIINEDYWNLYLKYLLEYIKNSGPVNIHSEFFCFNNKLYGYIVICGWSTRYTVFNPKKSFFYRFMMNRISIEIKNCKNY